jgi:hypothetical protein
MQKRVVRETEKVCLLSVFYIINCETILVKVVVDRSSRI